MSQGSGDSGNSEKHGFQNFGVHYPRSIYNGVNPAAWELGELLQFGFSYLLPILLVVTVPAELLVKPFSGWEFPAITLASAIVGLIVARSVFVWSLKSYRSASS